MRIATLLLALICFASFGWQMVHHFERPGKPQRGMLLTAFSGPVFAAVHVAALAGRPLLLPVPALFLYGVAAGLFWWAIEVTRGRQLAACFQALTPPQMVRCGPYRLIRHPFYTSYALAWMAGFVATLWWPLVVTAIFMAALYRKAARDEEQLFLRSGQRAEYLEYIRTTRRFIPIGSKRNPKKMPLKLKRLRVSSDWIQSEPPMALKTNCSLAVRIAGLLPISDLIVSGE